MGVKRKLDQDVRETAPPLSAFAVAKARKDSQKRSSDVNDSDDQAPHAQGNESLIRSHNEVKGNDVLEGPAGNDSHPNDEEPWEPTSLDYDSEAGMADKQLPDQGYAGSSESHLTLKKELSSWKPLDGNISSTQIGQRIHMTYGQTLAILGQFDLNVHNGVISIYGAFLGPKSPIRRVISPSTEPLPVIRCVSSDGAQIDLLNVPADENFESLGRISGHFRDIWSCKCPNCQEMGDDFTFRKVLDSRDLCLQHNTPAVEYPPTWQRATSKFGDGSQENGSIRIVIICGALRSGKSTFCRFLTNKLLTSNNDVNSKSVAYIDLDPNRPEISLPGHIGLFSLKHPILGASFTNGMVPFISPNKSHFVGCGQQVLSTAQYLAAAKDLIHVVNHNDFRSIHRNSIIVHSPGWYQGSGNEIVFKLISALQVTDVVFLSDPSPTVKNGIEQMVSPPVCHSIITHSLASFRSPRSRAEILDMALIHHFHRYSPRNQKLNLTPISSWRPYSVSFQEDRKDFKAIVVLGEVPPMYSNMLSRLVNGGLVSVLLVDVDYQSPEVILGEGDELPYFPPSSQGYFELPDPSKTKAVGLVLIRSIDLETKSMLILGASGISQFPPERLLLVSGGMESPGWAYTEDHEYQKYATRSGDEDAHLFLAKSSSGYPWVHVGDEGYPNAEIKNDISFTIP